jgi:hypothetical protein
MANVLTPEEKALLASSDEFANKRMTADERARIEAKIRAMSSEEIDRLSNQLAGTGAISITDDEGTQVTPSPDINIEGVFKRKELTPSDVSPLSDAELASSFQFAVDALETGKPAVAEDFLDAAIKAQEAVLAFRPDLTPEAIAADREADARRQLLGKDPLFSNTRLGEFQGERRAPFDLERGVGRQAQQDFRDFRAEDRAVRAEERANEAQRIALNRFKLDTKRAAFDAKKYIDQAKRLRLLTSRKLRQEDVGIANAAADRLRNQIKDDVETRLNIINTFMSSPVGLEKKNKKFLETQEQKLLDGLEAFERQDRILKEQGL